jgi:PAS domain S-box-containing protein
VPSRQRSLADLVDLERLQSMCDGLSDATGMVLAVLDPSGDILIASGWQDICTQFHRASETGLVGCIESDATINRRLTESISAPEHIEYRCANGLWDVAFPLIIAGDHLANVFTGQFFYDDDDVNVEEFRERARRFGFDEAAYLGALERVPVLSHERVEHTVTFLRDFVGVLADLGLSAAMHRQEREAIGESAERYLSLFENMTEGVALHDLVRDERGEPVDYRILAVNPAYTGQTGLTADAACGKLGTEVYGTDQAPYLAEFVRSVITGKPFHFEAYFEPLERHFDITVVKHGDDGFATIFHDVTERKRAEAVLRGSEATLRAILDATPFPVALADLQGDAIEFWSSSALELFGHVVSTTAEWYEVAYPDPEYRREVLERWMPLLEEARSSGRPVNTGEYRITCHDGSERICELWATFVADRLVVTFNDVTKRRRAEDALEQRLLALTQPLESSEGIAFDDLFNRDAIQLLQDDFARAAGVASIITHVDGTPITTPSGFCRLCNDIIRQTDKGLANCYASDAALGRLQADGPIVQQCLSGGLWDAGAAITVGGRHIANWLIGQVRDEAQTEAAMAAYARQIGADEHAVVEAFAEVPSMSRAQFESVAQALFRLASQLSSIAYQNVQQARFITQREQAEKEILKLNAELEQRVLDRTAQLAAKNDELKGFAYTVSHDLKAPLRGIAGYADELDRRHRDGLGERADFCVTQILTATRNMDHLIEDLLRYSRMDAETVSFTEVDIHGTVEVILRDRRLVIGEQHIDVTVDIPFVTVRTWERGLAQVLANLIDNAIKFSRDADSPRICIGGEESDGAWTLSVGDNGVGFDMKYHDRIFGLFNRLVRAEEFEGTGAGLAIAKKVMEKQGGRMWAEAAPGRGATFFVELTKSDL